MWRPFAVALLLGVMPSAGAAERCAPSFTAFLARFEKDFAFQLKQSREPLIYAYRDPKDYPDGALIEKKLSRSNLAALKEPLYPTPTTQKDIPLKRSIERKGSRQHVRFDKPESDAYSTEYHFLRTSDCWLLTRVQPLFE